MQGSTKHRALTSRSRAEGRGFHLGHLAIVLLSMGTLVRCECDTQTFSPAATYSPASVLDFGPVAKNTEKTMRIKVLSSGSAGLKILAANLQNARNPTKWKVVLPDALTTGLSPSRTSSISVTYRPCYPMAWKTVTITDAVTHEQRQIDQIDPTFTAWDSCDGDPEAADLVVVEEGTREGSHTIHLTAAPVGPPSVLVYCQNGNSVCNDPNPNIIPCVGMLFGNVTAGDAPCDLVVELQNHKRADKPVGDLTVDRIEISVRNLQTHELKSGTDVGFEILDMSGNPLTVDQTTPLTVPAPSATPSCAGGSAGCAATRFKIRFSGLVTGTWMGLKNDETGIRIHTSDPDNPTVLLNATGTGSAPGIAVFPSSLNFGNVAQGTTKTATTTVSNVGDANLVISSLGFQNDHTGAHFTYTTNHGDPPITLAPNDRFDIYVRYAPTVAGQDADALLIGNNDPATMGRVSVPLTGGAVPHIRVDPSDTLVFPNPQPPSTEPRTGTVRISNVGSGDLTIQRLEITGPGGDPTHPSADDFSILECAGQSPCTRTDVLCAPSAASCPAGASEKTFTIVYQNNDISTTDLAELHIRSNDPFGMEQVLVLSAEDTPCFFPNPIITVQTPRPCRGQPVQVSAENSQPGGTAGSTIMTYSWSWLFTPASSPAFSPNDSGTPTTTFTPTDSGTYILGLDVVNSCGRRSQVPASETINVADSCN